MSEANDIKTLQRIRGIPFQGTPWFNKKNIEDALDYPPRDGDVILASYPKTGCHWMQYIVLQVISGGEFFPSFGEPLNIVVPLMGISEISTIESLAGPRMYKHHFPYDKVKKNPNSKVLYIYRKPEDVFVSYFYFLNEMRIGKFDFEKYFEDFLSGNVFCGRYFEHVLSYFAHEKDQNLLLVSYEKLHRNKREEILRIAKFLGNNYYQHLIDNESALEKVIEHTSFDYMKKNLAFDISLLHKKDGETPNDPQVINYFRKGAVGDGKKTLTEVQSQRLRNLAEELMEGTEVLRNWYKEYKSIN